MSTLRFTKAPFTVIGKLGSTEDGDGFVARLWEDANGHFNEVASLAKKDAEGRIVGVWGAMSDFSLAFAPWEDFCHGLYLAGVECTDDAEAPEGWTRWRVPGFEFFGVENDGKTSFSDALGLLLEQGLSLAAAAQDFSDPVTGKSFFLFPIHRV